MRSRVELLREELDDAYRMIRDRVEGLSDEEFWWAPVAGAWSVRQTKRGTWAADYEEPDPDPAPFTTIGWRVVHVAECKVMYHEYAFGEARLTWPELDSPHTATDAIASLERGHRLLADSLDGSLDDAELERPVKTNWGESWPAWRIFWTMIHHDLWHGGEIGVMRDLFRAQRNDGLGESDLPGSIHS
jgi:hypothetical protein